MSGKCPVCGAPMDGNVCGYCGYREAAQAERTAVADRQPIIINNIQQNANVAYRMPVRFVSEKSRTVALLLCIFLGVLGGHQFYSGKIGKGILYLFTAGLLGFGVIIDFFKILFGSFKDSNGLPLKDW